jgi:hypothetical protein
MTVSANLTEFHGFKVEDFDPEKPDKDWSNLAARIRVTYDMHEAGTTFTDLFTKFLKQQGLDDLKGLVIGMWNMIEEGDSAERMVETIASMRDHLPALKALFIGDIVSEENEISWINQTDVSPLFTAFAGMEAFGVRGGNNLSLGRPVHDKLQHLVVEAGGLPRRVVQEVCQAKLPELTHLELWLGSDNYGATTTAQDLEPILAGELFPKLTTLAVRNCEWADDLAALVANAAALDKIKRLDLSLGNMGDQGAQALVSSPKVAKLEELDLHHHYIGEELQAKLKALGPRVNLEGKETPDAWDGQEHRYIAVSE